MTNLPIACDGNISRVNHCYSILFMSILILVLSEKTTKWNLLAASLCIAGAMLFRLQNIILLAIPFCFLLQEAPGQGLTTGKGLFKKIAGGQQKHILILISAPLAACIIIGFFNFLRFGNPFEMGYIYCYRGETHVLAVRAQAHGLISLYYLPENLYRTFLAFPRIRLSNLVVTKVLVNPYGNSLLFSQPVLLLFLFAGKGLRSARGQAFFLTGLLLAVPVWLWHNPGFYAPGYMRYSLDYFTIWIFALAVFCSERANSKIFSGLVIFFTAWALYYTFLLFRADVVVIV